MLVGVSHDETMFKGGIGSATNAPKGTAAIEPFARITASGTWQHLPCDQRENNPCIGFERNYLSKPHQYIVVGPDGVGARISATPVTLSECYGYDSTATYSGNALSESTIASDSPDLFAASTPIRRLDPTTAVFVQKALGRLVSSKLDSTKYIRLFSLKLEGKSLIVVQRAFEDYANISEDLRPNFVFAIGIINNGQFQILHWKANREDESERVLGTFRLKSGREFLVTSVSDPESQMFRVYGIEDGQLKLVFSGGGSSC